MTTTKKKAPPPYEIIDDNLIIRDKSGERSVRIPTLPAKVIEILPDANAPSYTLTLEDGSSHTVSVA